MLRSLLRNPAALSLRENVVHALKQRPTSRLFATESKADEQRQQAQEPEQAQEASTQPAADQASDQSTVERLTKQLEEKEVHVAQLNDRILRVLAEMENVRMIARRDVENAKKYAITPFAMGLLSVADNLGLALKSVPESAINGDEANPQLKSLFVGVRATETELLKVFSQHGITRFGDVGDTFDPNKYQAMFEAPMADHEPGTVIDVSKLGYTVGDRILRPAEVGVSKSP